ncbi:hypothetical protein [Streptomyces sp. AM8-1-1]|uniref:hypothetical protein n=1 Tax=Streptomyces sp. AM8-1-1 TaxID=3075825 RepID=UPI0028C3AC56|nr:hypothetical protein [Streptomyces sp. AM8-1-1]WNO71566.1 hypothetical protein RPQ07_07935 [Streptomyces sp. AM8-1-1]
MSWRVARCLDVLLRQIDGRFPHRDRASDGAIGDADHQKRDSDHNPWYGPGIVTARDFTHDLVNGVDIGPFTRELADTRDRRIKYIIANGLILDSRSWQWNPYHGDNPHTRHFHLSVVADPVCDDTSPWAVPTLGEVPSEGGDDANRAMFTTWGTSVNVRAEPRLDAAVVRLLPGPTRVHVRCQTHGDLVRAAGLTNDAWSFVPDLGGYVSNIFVDHPDAWLPGVDEC